jgi:hypothetical protein
VKIFGRAGGAEPRLAVAVQGKCAEARQLLAEIGGWFTEGFDPADHQEAKALLDELAENSTCALESRSMKG